MSTPLQCQYLLKTTMLTWMSNIRYGLLICVYVCCSKVIPVNGELLKTHTCTDNVYTAGNQSLNVEIRNFSFWLFGWLGHYEWCLFAFAMRRKKACVDRCRCRCFMWIHDGAAPLCCWSIRVGVYGFFRSRYFPPLSQNVVPTHGPLSCGMVSALQTPQTLIHIHTEALSVTASLFAHWDTLSTFIAAPQCRTLSQKGLFPHPQLHQPEAWTTPCREVTASLPVLFCFASNTPAP